MSEPTWVEVSDDDEPFDPDRDHPDALDRFEGADDNDALVPSEHGSEADVWGGDE